LHIGASDIMEALSFISIDTETTGLSFTDDRVIQFGIAVFINGSCVYTDTIFIANTDVPNGGFAINGISDEQIASGMPPAQAFAMISLLMEKRFGDKWMPRVCVYNAPFDLSFLAQEFRRHNIRYDFSSIQVLDPLIMWRHFKPFTSGKLVNVCSQLDIPLLNAHDAGADAEAAGHVYLGLRSRYGLLRNLYMNNILALWHSQWTQRMIEWKPDISIEPWPIREDWKCSLPVEKSSLF
jgi:DNA polymerase III alpha subunit (gram-positive type)